MGIHDHDDFKLGLVPHDLPDEAILHLDWAAGQVPAYAPAKDNLTGVTIGLDGNDTFGDCGPTSCDNHRRVTTRALLGVEQDATVDQVFDLYRRSGNPRFDPATGDDDNGVSMPVLLGALRNGGLGGHKALAYARLRDTSDASVYAAIDFFGAVLFAVDLQTAQQAQSGGADPTWDYQASADWGGHAVVAAAYDSTTGLVDVGSWGMRVRTTSAFRAHQLGEVWVPIWPETLGDHRFQQSVDLTQLAQVFSALTGGTLPVPVAPPAPPAPAPTPTPSPAAGLRVTIGNVEVARRVLALAQRHGEETPDAYVTKHFEHYFGLVDAAKLDEF